MKNKSIPNEYCLKWSKTGQLNPKKETFKDAEKKIIWKKKCVTDQEIKKCGINCVMWKWVFNELEKITDSIYIWNYFLFNFYPLFFLEWHFFYECGQPFTELTTLIEVSNQFFSTPFFANGRLLSGFFFTWIDYVIKIDLPLFYLPWWYLFHTDFHKMTNILSNFQIYHEFVRVSISS